MGLPCSSSFWSLHGLVTKPGPGPGATTKRGPHRGAPRRSSHLCPAPRAIRRGLRRDGSGNHRWGDREGWGAEWWLGRCASEVRFPVEKVGYRQAMPRREHGAMEPDSWDWPPGHDCAAQRADRSPGPWWDSSARVPSSSFGLSQVSGGDR